MGYESPKLLSHQLTGMFGNFVGAVTNQRARLLGKLKGISANLLLLMVGGVIAFGLGEVAVRVLSGSGELQTWEVSPISTHDSVMGWRFIPNTTGRRITSEYSTTERINAAGYRGPVVSLNKPDSTFRVVVLGDSYAEGYTVEESEMFSAVLREELHVDSYANVDVVNLGVSGYSTDQQLLTFDRTGRHYEPDLTVLMFYENDVWSNGQSDYYGFPKPVFELVDGAAVLRSVAGPKINRGETGRGSADPLARRIDNWLKDWSHFYGFVRLNAKKVPLIYSLARKFGLTEGASAVPADFFAWAKAPPPEVEYAWALTAALLRRLNQEVREQGGRFVLFYIPSPARIDAAQWEATKRLYQLDDAEWSPDEPRIRVMRICEALEALCIDPTEEFLARDVNLSETGQSTYFKLDRHWTLHGHKLAGRMLAERITRWLGDARRPETPSRN